MSKSKHHSKNRKSTMSVPMSAEELKLLRECCAFEPWIADNIRRAKKRGPRFDFVLEGEERTDALSALEASAQFAKEQGDDDKSIDFSVLHDKIIVFTPDNF